MQKNCKYWLWFLILGHKIIVLNTVEFGSIYFNLQDNWSKEKGYLHKEGKALAQETTDLAHAFYEDDEYSRKLPRKKDYVSIQKGVRKQKRLVLCNLHDLFVAFKERNPDMKIGFSKFCTLHPKWCVIAGLSGTSSVCVCTTHQNTILLVDALNWKVT